eukprot:6203797-Pleurochrysis_carterae.AAC.2
MPVLAWRQLLRAQAEIPTVCHPKAVIFLCVCSPWSPHVDGLTCLLVVSSFSQPLGTGSHREKLQSKATC